MIYDLSFLVYYSLIIMIIYHLFMIYYDVLWPVLPEVQTQVEEEARAVWDPPAADPLCCLLFTDV